MPDEFRFDTLVIDEAQDFSPDMLRLVVALGRGGTQDIKIAEDAAQDIFGRKPRRFAYRDVGIHIRGVRSHRFKALVPLAPSPSSTSPTNWWTPIPPWREARTTTASSRWTWWDGTARRPRGDPVATSRAWCGTWFGTSASACSRTASLPAEVAILYLHRLLVEGTTVLEPFSPQDFCGRVREALQHEGIPVSWFTRDSAAKRALDLGEGSVKLGSVYSAKGLDFEVVYLLDLTREPLPPAGARVSPRDEHHRRLLFVGATRARERLTLLSLEQASPRRGREGA